MTQKHTLLTFVLCVFALHAKAASPVEVCNRLINLRPRGTGRTLCTDPGNDVDWDGAATTITLGVTIPQPSKCDHLVELQLVKTILEEKICTPLIADTKMDDFDKRQILKKFSDIINNANENLFLANKDIETYKGGAFNIINSGQPMVIQPNDVVKAKAVGDYLTKTADKSRNTAKLIDAQIAAVITDKKYPAATGTTLETRWNAFLGTYSNAIPSSTQWNYFVATYFRAVLAPAPETDIVDFDMRYPITGQRRLPQCA